ncbi:uncharacterized protein [Haliotis asinina]|uniref:uncharacterized protein n=1 Tax=Haliotis asinina TaxID=109174 RepID=UPI0035322F0E
MSATTFISWRVIYLAGCLLQGAVLMDIRMSKACYGAAGLNCTKHSISCMRSQKIAIVDAYFTFNRQCSAGISHCQEVNPDNVTVSRRKENFNTTELISLYDNCSTESQCGYQAPRGSVGAIFSVVKYRCIDGNSIIPIAEASGWSASETSIMRKHTVSRNNRTYTCEIQSQMPINITALDMRLGDGNDPTRCSLLTISGKPYTCVDVIEPYKQLKTIQSPGQLFITLQVKEDPRSVVWLGITSTSSVFIKCTATLISPRVTVTERSSTESPGTTVTVTERSSTESPGTTDLTRTGVIAAAVVGALLFAAMVFAFFWCWRNRKIDEKPIPQIPRRTTLDGNRKTTHTAANSPQQCSYDEIDDLRQHLASNYDYATSNHVPDSNTYFLLETKEYAVMSNNDSNPTDEYNHTGQLLSPLSGTYDTTESAAKSMMGNNGSNPTDEYDHTGQGLSPLSGTYDTTESAAKSMMDNNGSNPTDEYNHLGQGVSPLSGTYDTTASAAKSMTGNNGSNPTDEYNHLGQGVSPLSGTYDTTASAAKSMMGNNGSNPTDEYNHLGQGVSPLSGTYDTTASAAKSMMGNNGSNPTDEYNHLGQGVSPLSGTYDTTASAAKSMMGNNGSNPTDIYNRLGQGVSPLSGTYDTTASAAKSMMGNNGSNPTDIYNHLGQGLSPLSGTYDTTASVAKPMELAGSRPADAWYDHLKQKTPTEHISNTYDITEMY